MYGEKTQRIMQSSEQRHCLMIHKPFIYVASGSSLHMALLSDRIALPLTVQPANTLDSHATKTELGRSRSVLSQSLRYAELQAFPCILAGYLSIQFGVPRARGTAWRRLGHPTESPHNRAYALINRFYPNAVITDEVLSIARMFVGQRPTK
jgi:hypothetical protein